MRIVEDGVFIVYVYPDEFYQPHHMPHCHVRWSGGETVLFLPTLKRVAGPTIPRKGTRFLIDHLEEICDGWNKCNPERTVDANS